MLRIENPVCVPSEKGISWGYVNLHIFKLFSDVAGWHPTTSVFVWFTALPAAKFKLNHDYDIVDVDDAGDDNHNDAEQLIVIVITEKCWSLVAIETRGFFGLQVWRKKMRWHAIVHQVATSKIPWHDLCRTGIGSVYWRSRHVAGKEGNQEK